MLVAVRQIELAQAQYPDNPALIRLPEPVPEHASCRQLLRRRLLGMHPVGGGLRLAGGGEDGARIVFQHTQPRCHVCGMIGARMVGDPEVGEHK